MGYSNNLFWRSRSSCSRMYLRTAFSSRPTVLTQYPVAQKCNPDIRRSWSNSRCILTALFPLRNPTANATLYFGGMLKHKCTWSSIACPSSKSIFFCSHSSRKIRPTFLRRSPNITFLRYFGIQITWYLHSHRTCDKLSKSFIRSSSCPLGLSHGGRAYIIFGSPERLSLPGSHGHRPWV
jgi:hypothetical protein